MPSVHYLGLNHEVHCQDDHSTILDLSIEKQIPHVHECGGHGNCTTCRVRILDGLQNVSPPTAKEVSLSKLRKWDPTIRLACQCTVKGNIKVQRLIWSMGEVNKLQMETVPEGIAEARNIAILFCDLRGFTKIASENLAFDMAHMLNRFYTILGEPILMNNGIIYQYVGDEIIGVFGTSGGTSEKNCTDAVRAAIGMRYAVERLNKFELTDFDTEFKIGIGINYGNAYVGHLGHPLHRMFSVVGDPVNVASRIEGYTKNAKTDILVSNHVLKRIPKHLLDVGKTYEAYLSGVSQKTIMTEISDFTEMDLQLELQSSLNMMLDDEDKFAQCFYRILFEVAPFTRSLFKKDMISQGRLLTHMLGGIVYSLSRPEHLAKGMKKLGQSHARYGVKDEYYPIVANVMIRTIKEIMGDLYTNRIEEAWTTALNLVTDMMKNWDK